MRFFLCFRKDVERISRFDYWTAYFALLIASSLLDVVFFAAWQTFEPDIAPVLILAGIEKILELIYLYLLTVKRFHDAGWATWCLNVCILLSFVVIGAILIFLVTIQKSDKKNAWGECPQ